MVTDKLIHLFLVYCNAVVASSASNEDVTLITNVAVSNVVSNFTSCSNVVTLL